MICCCRMNSFRRIHDGKASPRLIVMSACTLDSLAVLSISVCHKCGCANNSMVKGALCVMCDSHVHSTWSFAYKNLGRWSCPQNDHSHVSIPSGKDFVFEKCGGKSHVDAVETRNFMLVEGIARLLWKQCFDSLCKDLSMYEQKTPMAMNTSNFESAFIEILYEIGQDIILEKMPNSAVILNQLAKANINSLAGWKTKFLLQKNALSTFSLSDDINKIDMAYVALSDELAVTINMYCTNEDSLWSKYNTVDWVTIQTIMHYITRILGSSTGSNVDNYREILLKRHMRLNWAINAPDFNDIFEVSPSTVSIRKAEEMKGPIFHIQSPVSCDVFLPEKVDRFFQQSTLNDGYGGHQKRTSMSDTSRNRIDQIFDNKHPINTLQEAEDPDNGLLYRECERLILGSPNQRNIIPTDMPVKSYVYHLHAKPSDGILYETTMPISLGSRDLSENDFSNHLNDANQEIDLTNMGLNLSESTCRGVKRLISFIQSHGSKKYRVASLSPDHSVILVENAENQMEEEIFSDWIQGLDVNF